MNVFEDLRQAFRQAVENFKEELNRDQVTDAVDGLLRRMSREVVDARAYLHRLEEDMRDAIDRGKAEAKNASTCRRREELAKEIGDSETAQIAREFAERHERRASVLERRASALGEEIALRKTEIIEMEKRLKEAGRQREGLRSRVGTTRARETLGSDDLFAELDRLAERIDDEGRYAGATEEIDEIFADEGAADDPGATSPSVADLERRLEELKRQMERGEGRGGQEATGGGPPGDAGSSA